MTNRLIQPLSPRAYPTRRPSASSSLPRLEITFNCLLLCHNLSSENPPLSLPLPRQVRIIALAYRLYNRLPGTQQLWGDSKKHTTTKALQRCEPRAHESSLNRLSLRFTRLHSGRSAGCLPLTSRPLTRYRCQRAARRSSHCSI